MEESSLSSQDREHLRILSIFHYVVAGLSALFSMFPVLHVGLGLLMVTGNLPGSSFDRSDRWMGWIFVVGGLVVIFLGLTFSACLFLAGRFLSRRRHHVYCLVMAGFACTFVPFGTVLGVFTIVVLMRDSVKASFQVGSAP